MTNSTEYDDLDTIQRCPHDKENPYVMVSRDLVREKSLSPECRWLLIYLLSNDSSFKIKIKTIINHLEGHKGYGRDGVRKMIQQLCEEGYMKRVLVMKGNLNNGFKYYISETPKFKECISNLKKILRRTDFQGPEFQASVDQALLRKNKSSSYEEDISKETTTLVNQEPKAPKSKKQNDDVSSENLMKALKDAKKVERALAYWCKHEEWVRKKASKSLVGFLVDLVRNDRDLIENGHLTLRGVSEEWAKTLAKMYGEKYRFEACKDGIVFIFPGGRGHYEINYNEEDFKQKVLGRFEKMGLIIDTLDA